MLPGRRQFGRSCSAPVRPKETWGRRLQGRPKPDIIGLAAARNFVKPSLGATSKALIDKDTAEGLPSALIHIFPCVSFGSSGSYVVAGVGFRTQKSRPGGRLSI